MYLLKLQGVLKDLVIQEVNDFDRNQRDDDPLQYYAGAVLQQVTKQFKVVSHYFQAVSNPAKAICKVEISF